MLYEAAVKDYITNCHASGKSNNTIASYSRTLDFFHSFLAEMGVQNVEDVTPVLLASWKAESAKRLSATSLRLYCTHLKGFFDFCSDIEYIEKNPYKKKLMEVAVKDSDRKNTTSHVLSKGQFRTIFTNEEPSGMHRKSINRNRAILALLITSGIRCESLCRLTFSDLNREENTIRVCNAKGGKNGEILFSDIAAQAVSDYISSGYRGNDFPVDDPLFGFVDGNGIWTPYCREQMSAIVEAAVRGFTGERGFRAHAMRHTCASLLSAGGMSDGEISKLLMHSDGTGAQVTNRYIERDNRELFEKANRIFNKILIKQG